MGPIDVVLKQSRDVLSGIYRSDPRKMGDFGFEVDDSAKAKKPTKAA